MKNKNFKSSLIGIIVPEIKHPFFAAILDGIEEVAFKKGFGVLLSQSNEKYSREVAAVNHLVSLGVDGLLISVSQETKNGQHLKWVLEKKIPLVFFDRVCEDVPVTRVVVDDYEGAYKATEHLILSGYTRIAHFAGYNYLKIAKDRLKGYKAALENYDFTFDEKLVFYGGLSQEDGEKNFKEFLKLKPLPDAIFAVNDPVAIGILNGMKKAGIRVQEDIGLVGFSNNQVVAMIEPPLTTVSQPRYEMGKVAAQMLIEQIENGSMYNQNIEKVLKTKLIIRQTT